MDCVATLDVEQQAVVLVDLGNGDDIYAIRVTLQDIPMNPAGNLMSVRVLPSTRTLRSLRISMAFIVSATFLKRNLATGESILQAIAQEDDQRQRLTQLVGASRGASSL